MSDTRRGKEDVDATEPCVRRRAEGQGLAEYALILALIALALIAALILLGTDFSTVLSDLGELIDRAT
jgi:Flp pilus assembly pilin Flp